MCFSSMQTWKECQGRWFLHLKRQLRRQAVGISTWRNTRCAHHQGQPISDKCLKVAFRGKKWHRRVASSSKQKKVPTTIRSFLAVFSERLTKRSPLDGRRVDSETRLLKLRRFDVFIYQFWCDANDVLSLPIFDHVHGLQRRNTKIHSNM